MKKPFPFALAVAVASALSVTLLTMMSTLPLNAVLANTLGTDEQPVSSEAASRSGLAQTLTDTISLTVDIQNREEVIEFFKQDYLAYEDDPIAWSGSFDTCTPGVIDASTYSKTLHRINYFRAMAGVSANIVLDDSYNADAQAAALIMGAHGELSHYPTPNWTCYTPEGAQGASHSNLSLNRTAWQAVSGQIEDEGNNNARVGHRQWLLRVETKRMGVGVVVRHPESSNFLRDLDAAAIWVYDDEPRVPDPTVLMRDGFIAWPPPGFVPFPLLYRRWSISIAGADFTTSTVQMRLGTQNLDTNIELRTAEVIYPTLVWLPSEISIPDSGGTITYTILISDVVVNGVPSKVEYQVLATDFHFLPIEIFTESPLTVPEDIPFLSTFAQLQVRDPDLGETHDFTLVDTAKYPDNNLFQIFNSWISPIAPLDFETSATHHINVKATDSWGMSITQVFTISVTDVEEANLYIPTIKSTKP